MFCSTSQKHFGNPSHSSCCGLEIIEQHIKRSYRVWKCWSEQTNIVIIHCKCIAKIHLAYVVLCLHSTKNTQERRTSIRKTYSHVRWVTPAHAFNAFQLFVINLSCFFSPAILFVRRSFPFSNFGAVKKNGRTSQPEAIRRRENVSERFSKEKKKQCSTRMSILDVVSLLQKRNER